MRNVTRNRKQCRIITKWTGYVETLTLNLNTAVDNLKNDQCTAAYD